MNHLSQIPGLHMNLPKREFIDILSLQPASTLKLIRTSLFTVAKSRQNTIPDEVQGLSLVSRRDSALRPITTILSEDIWSISQAIGNNTSIPRTMFRNGKRSRQFLSTAPCPTQEPGPPCPAQMESCTGISPSQSTGLDSQSSGVTSQPSLPSATRVSDSLLIRELNSVKKELHTIKTDCQYKSTDSVGITT